MTHYRLQSSVHGRLADVLEAVANADLERLHMRRDTLQKKSVPGRGSELYLEEAARLDALLSALGKRPVFGPLFAEMVERYGADLRKDPRPPADIGAALRNVFIEAGDLTRAVHAAMADGVLTLPERREIAREAQDLIDAATSIRDAVEPPQDLRSLNRGAA